MTKKITPRKKDTKKLSQSFASTKMHTKIVSAFVAVIALTVGAYAIVHTTSVQGARDDGSIPLASTAQASVTNVEVTTTGNSINVQFDYDLANGAESSYVDVALSSRMSFNPNIVTGPGHYNETVTDLADGTYYLAIIISGNPDYVLGDTGPANKPLFITLPETKKTKNGDPFVRTVRHFFHHQKKDF